MSTPKTVIRVERHERNYLTVSNATVQDERLSWEARGMLVYLLSLPSDWRITVGALQRQGGAGRDAVRRILHELQTFGYASGFGRPDGHANDGRFAGSIVVYETPDLRAGATPAEPPLRSYPMPTPEKPSSVKPTTAQPTTAQPTPEKPSIYKVRSGQKTDSTNTPPPARTRAPSTDVGGREAQQSRYGLKERKAYAKRHGLGGGWLTNSRDGRYDANLDLDLERDTTPPSTPPAASSAPICSMGLTAAKIHVRSILGARSAARQSPKEVIDGLSAEGRISAETRAHLLDVDFGSAIPSSAPAAPESASAPAGRVGGASSPPPVGARVCQFPRGASR